MSIRYIETKSDTDSRMEIDLGDGRYLNVVVTREGIIMDVFVRRPEYADQDEYLGTAGMMFDEWADWVVSSNHNG